MRDIQKIILKMIDLLNDNYSLHGNTNRKSYASERQRIINGV